MWFLSGFLFLLSIYLFFVLGVHFFGCLALGWLACFVLARITEPWRVDSKDLGPRAMKNFREVRKTFTKDA